MTTRYFYHIYPLGLCGCAHENDGQAVPGAFNKLNAWAEHAADIGCTAIYIGPLFESGSHGYDTIDYRLVDRRLGTNAEFKDFVARCHARGQKVIVDGVFNHVGRDFFAFQDLKANRENARYKDWFCDVNFWGNNEYNDGFSYGNWGGFNLLVKLNQRNPEVQNYHYDTIRFWVDEFDIDGIRLDAADVLDFDFMRGLRRLANEVKPEFWLMGEGIQRRLHPRGKTEELPPVPNQDTRRTGGAATTQLFRDRPHHAPSAGPVPRYPAVSVLGQPRCGAPAQQAAQPGAHPPHCNSSIYALGHSVHLLWLRIWH